MNRLRNILILGLAVCCTAVSGQTYDRVVRRNFWNDSRNVAGIRLDSLSRSYAEVYGRYDGGGLRDTWQAEEGWSAGAVTESIRHLDKISLTGSFSFEQTEGYGMCGSMFMSPGYYPIDVMEFTPGRKSRQTYSFDGGFSYDMNDFWSVGARMDFESANLAKLKDLRYTDWKLDMTVAPGIIYRRNRFAVGLSPVFRKTSETIDATQIGTAESSYYAFFDKGLMYGISQVWTGSGVHLSESGVNGLPVREFSYGGAVQAQYGGLYMSFELLGTSGSAGEKEYIWFRFPGTSMRYDIRYRSDEHTFRLHFDQKIQRVDESVLEKVNENGVVTVLDHGSNRIFSRETVSLAPEYEYLSDRFELTASVDLDWRKGLSSQIYPYIYTQSLMTVLSGVDALVHIGKFDIGAGLSYRDGKVSETERYAQTGQEVQTVPYRLQDWYDMNMEYATASMIASALSVRWNFFRGLYVEASADWMHGFDLRFIDGSDRIGAGFKIGYTF